MKRIINPTRPSVMEFTPGLSTGKYNKYIAFTSGKPQTLNKILIIVPITINSNKPSVVLIVTLRALIFT